MTLGRGSKVGYPRRSGFTGGRWILSPWKGCAPFCGRSWIVIFNTISGSSAISGKSVLWPCFACGGPKRTTRANAFCNLSMTHLKNDTANYLGLRHSRRAFSFLSLTCRTGIWLSVGAMPAQVLHRPRIWGQSLTLRSDLPLPGDPTGGSIVAPNPLRGMPAGLGYTTTPHTSHGPRPGWRIGPRYACPICGGRRPEHIPHLHERHRGRPRRAASSA